MWKKISYECISYELGNLTVEIQEVFLLPESDTPHQSKHKSLYLGILHDAYELEFDFNVGQR